jgi:ABC-type multidrug transport system permease subunit
MMLGGLGAAIRKDLRLLARDRVGLVFLAVAPVIVITVAGFSLASLYGASARGTSPYELPFCDEDGGRIGQALTRALADEPAVRLRSVATRDEARDLIRTHHAGLALIVPAGTSEALADGTTAQLVVYTDPVKYLEVASLRVLVQELRHRVERAARDRAAAGLTKTHAHALVVRRRFERAADRLRRERARVAAALNSARDDAEARIASARRRAAHALDVAVAAVAAEREAAVRSRLAAELAPLQRYFAELSARQRDFTAWLAAVREKAGRLADRMPPPPTMPEPPPQVAALASDDPSALAARLLPPAAPITLPPTPEIDLPAPPALPDLELPAFPEPPRAVLPGSLGIDESSVTGAPPKLNTFDQNVPGFSITFLLLGMLLGVSLGLLDERDWGTLERLRAMPMPFTSTLVAKLLARFLVGVVQMIALFAIGRVAFGISLGPQPIALLLPTIGIVFAGTAFGLVVAAIARTREAVLPVGSIVIVTMAAVGGCWWPIDLEPPWMRQIALALPTTWAMAAFNDLMIRRQPLAAAIRPTAVLLAHGLVYLAVGLTLFRRQNA